MFEVIDRIFNPAKYPEVEPLKKQAPEPLKPMRIVKTVYPEGVEEPFYGMKLAKHD